MNNSFRTLSLVAAAATLAEGADFSNFRQTVRYPHSKPAYLSKIRARKARQSRPGLTGHKGAIKAKIAAAKKRRSK